MSKRASESLLDFIPKCPGPGGLKLRSPYHLADFCGHLERAPRGGLRVLCPVPIRHHKTWTVICAIAKWLKDDPTLNITYMSYDKRRVEDICKDVRELCRNIGITKQTLRDTILNWSTAEGGGVQGFSADQSRLGSDIDVLVWDDPIAGPDEADDPRIRDTVDRVIDFYTNRLMPKGSCIGVMSPFHPDDPMMRRRARGWSYQQASAIMVSPDGTERAFAPDVYTLDELKAKRAEIAEGDPSMRVWWSQWMCQPRSDATNYLNQPARYGTLPEYAGWRDAAGIDMAFTAGRASDWFAVAAGRFYGNRLYLMFVHRFKADPKEVPTILGQIFSQWSHMPVFSYVSGPERGNISTLAGQGFEIQGMQAKVNKLWRSQRMIGAWRKGEILVPNDPPWAKGFINRAMNFRGRDGDEDDEVDAVVSLYDGMTGFDGGDGPMMIGERRA